MSATLISRISTPAGNDGIIIGHRWTFSTSIRDVPQLEQLLSEPSDAAIDAMRRHGGDVVVLGVAGKMGPTLARMARRALDAAGVSARVIGVSRFSTPGPQQALEQHGIETMRCDLLDEDTLSRLPDAPNVIFMAGRKFGSTGDESLHLGDEHVPPRPHLPTLPDQPNRCVLDGERLWSHARRPRWIARRRPAGPDRRVRDQLSRPRTHVRVLQPDDVASRSRSCGSTTPRRCGMAC